MNDEPRRKRRKTSHNGQHLNGSGDSSHLDWPERVHDFYNMGLRPEIIDGIHAIGINYPSYVQERAIVPIVRGELNHCGHSG